MTGTNVTRQRTRSNSNVKMIDNSALNATNEENQIARSNRGEIVEQATTQLGKTAWDDVFEEGNLELPNTGFMNKIKQAVMEENYQHLKKEILNTLKDEKDQFCRSSYSTLKEARNKLYIMLTEMIAQEAGSILDHNIRMKQCEKNMIKKQMSQIEYNTDRAEAKSASKSKLIKELTVAKKELIKSARNEKEIGSTSNQKKDKVRIGTATQILYFLQLDMLPTPRDGI